MDIIECTKESPWDGKLEDNQRVIHPDAKEIGDYDSYIKMECDNCKYIWKEELAQ